MTSQENAAPATFLMMRIEGIIQPPNSRQNQVNYEKAPAANFRHSPPSVLQDDNRGECYRDDFERDQEKGIVYKLCRDGIHLHELIEILSQQCEYQVEPVNDP